MKTLFVMTVLGIFLSKFTRRTTRHEPVDIYRQTSLETKYTKSPYGLLQESFEDPSHIPEAPTIEALIVRSTNHAGKANVGLKHYEKEKAVKKYE